MALLIKKDPVAARQAAIKIERELGRALTEQERLQTIEIMEKHNPATAAGLRDFWDL